MKSIIYTIEQHWELKQRESRVNLSEDFTSKESWLPTRVPGDVYQTLLEAGKIPDPFYGLNELEVQWVGEADWLYRTTLEVDAATLEAPHIELCFDGLDTFATVWLNGQEILKSDNMFVPARVDVKNLLKAGQNTLHILFESAMLKGKELEHHYGPRQCWNGDASRMYVRKAQYHYGWDWGPILMTAGPWKDVRLEAFSTRIAEVVSPVEVAADLKSASVPVKVSLEGNTAGLEVEVSLIGPDGLKVQQVKIPAQNSIETTLAVDSPKLWWPNGYGEQPLYTLQVRVLENGTLLSEQSQRLGLRRLRVVQEPVEGEGGTSFYFEVNNLAIFGGGANWIPDDNLLTRISRERYFERVRQSKEANLTMLRVWGGGIYESEDFYDACDEMGILVWQDFLFACGLYPAHPEFLQSVKLEAEVTVRRLRHRASLAIWCGNNEDYQIAEAFGMYGPGKDSTPFVALEIYEHLLPEVCGHLDPSRQYWPGSPYTPGGDLSTNQQAGDRHSWEIWHGPMFPYQNYKRFEGRFVSEFGMQAYPALSTLEAYIDPAERFPQSRTVVHHNRAFTPGTGPDGHRRIAVYLSDNLKDPVTLENYVYATQFVQAEAMKYAYDDFRRRWGQPGKRSVGGALVWQINDCWPVVSWALIDSKGVVKSAYHVLRRALAPFALGIAPDGAVWGVNGTTHSASFTLELKAFTLDGTELKSESRSVSLEANATTELGAWPIESTQPFVVAARLLEGDKVVARTTQWPEPYKFYTFPDPSLKIEALGSDTFRLSVQRPAKGVSLVADPATWSNNFLDLIPGDPQTVQASGLVGKPFTVRWLDGEPLVFGK